MVYSESDYLAGNPIEDVKGNPAFKKKRKKKN